jgi:hypothetical protein
VHRQQLAGARAAVPDGELTAFDEHGNPDFASKHGGDLCDWVIVELVGLCESRSDLTSIM